MRIEDIIKTFEPKLTNDYQSSSVHCELITGAAGTGKTFLQKKKIEENEGYGILCATTGIAAINLGATTLNSILKFFDTDSLRDRFNRGSLTSTLHRLGRKIKRLVIDEVSMMDARQLDMIYESIRQANEYQDMEGAPMGITLTGDFLQLPPIKAPWVFEAECWEHFERNTTTLTKIWRQDNLQFLEAINAARSGQGKTCVEILSSIGVKFMPQQNGGFSGTTIMSKNDTVDNFNFSALMEVPGDAYGLRSMTWGDQAGEWKKNIPEMLKLKDGAYVMILSNSLVRDTSMEYANGDCGTVQSKDTDGTVWIKLKRNEKLVGIRPIIRYKKCSQEDADRLGLKPCETEEQSEDPDLVLPKAYVRPTHLYCDDDCGWDAPGLRHGPWGMPSYNCQNGTWNIGAIKYYPLRLAWATTVHKSQGLTLDTCQIDCRDPFFGQPGMAYVSLSRCRTPEGLVIVGTPDKLAERIKIDPKVRRWV
jgi:ATP-dependent DNA helicase PIF1